MAPHRAFHVDPQPPPRKLEPMLELPRLDKVSWEYLTVAEECPTDACHPQLPLFQEQNESGWILTKLKICPLSTIRYVAVGHFKRQTNNSLAQENARLREALDIAITSNGNKL